MLPAGLQGSLSGPCPLLQPTMSRDAPCQNAGLSFCEGFCAHLRWAGRTTLQHSSSEPDRWIYPTAMQRIQGTHGLARSEKQQAQPCLGFSDSASLPRPLVCIHVADGTHGKKSTALPYPWVASHCPKPPKYPQTTPTTEDLTPGTTGCSGPAPVLVSQSSTGPCCVSWTEGGSHGSLLWPGFLVEPALSLSCHPPLGPHLCTILTSEDLQCSG